MKGLAWFQVQSDIAFDGDLEFVSDGAFRLFIELISLSAYHLLDGVIPIELMKKRCHSLRRQAALEELEGRGLVERVPALSPQSPGIVARKSLGSQEKVAAKSSHCSESIFIPNYLKYQCSRAEVEAKREKEKTRVQAYRERSTPQVQRESKSKSKSKILTPLPPLQNPVVENLVQLAREIPGWKGDPQKDVALIEVSLRTLSAAQIKKTIANLSKRQAATGEYTHLRKTLSNWLNRETPEVQPGYVGQDLPEEPVLTAEQIEENKRRLAEITANFRSMA